jgi:NAD(P)H-hydrate repair Nnr-like enzyme with NAD(P)H-hydrate dehydratase domain
MGSAGMGDVLTGVIAAFIGQGMEPLEAAALGAYVHGLAGDAAGEKGKRGLTASDCLAAVQLILD